MMDGVLHHQELNLTAFEEFDFVLLVKLFAKLVMLGDDPLVECLNLCFIPNEAAAWIIPVQGTIVPINQVLKVFEQLWRDGQLGKVDRIAVSLVRVFSAMRSDLPVCRHSISAAKASAAALSFASMAWL